MVVSTGISRKGRQGLLWQLFYKLCGLSRTASSASEVVGCIEGDSGSVLVGVQVIHTEGLVESLCFPLTPVHKDSKQSHFS